MRIECFEGRGCGWFGVDLLEQAEYIAREQR
jgi:hypothetical protein